METTSIIIIGCGPTGAMLSGYLGQFSIPHVILERDAGITTDPRGIALDEDGIRLVQGLGIYDKIYTDIGSCMGIFNFIGGRHHDLSARPFMRLDYSTSEGGTGHVGFVCHKQPALEKHLREAAEKYEGCDIRSGCTVVGIEEDDEWVAATYRDPEGRMKSVRGRFLVGADGKTGFVRKMYLEPKGIRLEQAHESHYNEVWVAMNWQMTLPTPETHPAFPLWQLDYSPQDVYDAFFPINFCFLCNPGRAAVCGRFGLNEDRLWRFEFVIKEGEDADNMAGEEGLKKVVWPYLRHPSSRYGLKEDVIFPSDCVKVLRSRPFSFSARSCNKWALGRVALCGDAAHVFPPFGGQGIASGFRDANSLAWRLAIACRSEIRTSPAKYDALLRGWYIERKQQLENSLAVTIHNGAAVTENDPMKIMVRDWYLWAVQMVPAWRRAIEKGPRDRMTRYTYEPGMAFLEGHGDQRSPFRAGGKAMPQVYCRAVSGPHGELGPVRFTDDVIFDPAVKMGLFQVVVLLGIKHAEVDDALRILQATSLEKLSEGAVLGKEATFISHSIDTGNMIAATAPSIAGDLYRVATAEEFAQSELCRRRPRPKYYDPMRIMDELNGRHFVLLRPDRFVFAACDSAVALAEAARSLGQLIRGEDPNMRNEATAGGGYISRSSL